MKKLGIVFPGQGSQKVGMLADIAPEYPIIRQVYEEASEVLGYDLWKLVSEGPAEELDQTTRTQPALLASSYALWQVLFAHNKHKPSLLAGHSLGEYSALTCAQAISFRDAIKVVAARGEFMQQAVPPGQGGLAAIVGLEENTVREICEQAVAGNEVLSPANFNSQGQVVIAGHIPAVNRAIELANKAGAKIAKLLPVSVPSHCGLMKSAADQLGQLLDTIHIQKPNIPIINNVDVAAYETPEAIRDGLVRQLYMPVRWVEAVQYFTNRGVTYIIECGPGKVLTGLNRRIGAELTLMHTADLRSLREILDTEFEIE
jgi:[acyl-carrier-protein] S-malonyltransferase